MPKTSRKAGSTKRRVSKRSSTHRRAKTGRANRSTSAHRATRRTNGHRTNGETYVFECTRQGCSYKIVREEKAEIGQVRFDLKCPKCHHSEFKCLGKGDLPESPDLSFPISTLDLDHINPVNLGSN